MMRVGLFSGRITPAQQAIICFWLLNAGVILAIWLDTSLDMLTGGGPSGAVTAVGRLFGLAATFFALTQFMLMGRIAWLERRFGLDHLASYHRLNGYLAITCILIHPALITIGYALAGHTNIVRQYIDLILHYQDVWLALISEILFVAVVATTIYIVRKHLKFESWYFVHLLVYGAIIGVFFHQFALGGSFNGHPLARAYWYGLYLFVLLNVIIWRFGLSTYNLLRFDFRVSRVVAETSTTTSVYISGRQLQRFKTRPGQFIMVRVFSPGFWWQEHPFSLSWIPHDDQLRLTIRHVGDYTTAIARLKPGARVLVAGPFGRMTSEVAQTNKRLFIAGGVGITPIRSLAQEAVAAGFDSQLLYGNKTPDDVVFKTELDALADDGLKPTYVFSDPPSSFQGERGYVDGQRIQRLAPDFLKRDIYLCGPPPMMAGIIAYLEEKSFPPEQLHYERFALHA